MLQVDLGQHPVSLMVREAFMELQMSDEVKKVLKFHYPQDTTLEYADDGACSENDSDDFKPGGCVNEQGDYVDAMKKKNKN